MVPAVPAFYDARHLLRPLWASEIAVSPGEPNSLPVHDEVEVGRTLKQPALCGAGSPQEARAPKGSNTAHEDQKGTGWGDVAWLEWLHGSQGNVPALVPGGLSVEFDAESG